VAPSIIRSFSPSDHCPAGHHCCVPANARELESLTRELAAIERVQRNHDLQHDATARRELATRREEIHGHLQQTVAGYSHPTEPAVDEHDGIGPALKSARHRQGAKEFLSAVCDDLFCDAPPSIMNHQPKGALFFGSGRPRHFD